MELAKAVGADAVYADHYFQLLTTLIFHITLSPHLSLSFVGLLYNLANSYSRAHQFEVCFEILKNWDFLSVNIVFSCPMVR